MPETPIVNPLLVSVDRAATELALSRARVYELMSEGRIRSIKVGRSRRIPYAALVAFIDQLAAAAV